MAEIVCPIQEAAGADPARPAIIAPHRTYSYQDYHAHVAGARVKLRQAGLGEGDVLAIALPPGTPTPILCMALFRMGAVAFPVNTRFPAQYLLDALNKVRCRTMVVPYGASITTVHGRLFAMAPHDLVDDPISAAAAPAAIPPERPATIILTSGSTRSPKAALHSYGNHYHNARRANRNIPLEPGDRWLVSLPFFHVAGLAVLFRCALAGAAAVIPRAGAAIEASVTDLGVTHVSMVPTQLYRALRTSEGVAALRNLKAILLGGSAVPPELIERAHAAGLPLHTTYGMTESASQLTATPPDAPLADLLTSGRPLGENTVRIGPANEIQVRGDTLFRGYVDGSTVARPETEDGWFPTGDCGRFDARGNLVVEGRRDNMFVAGGENVHPEEIERRLCAAPGVAQAVVVAAPHPEFGATPVAFIRMESGGHLDASVLAAALAARLPKYKVPRHFFPLPVDEMAPDEKPSRSDLAQRAERLLRHRA